jgi:hypothetical protein
MQGRNNRPGSVAQVLDTASKRREDKLVVWLLASLCNDIQIKSKLHYGKFWSTRRCLAVQTSNCSPHLSLVRH